MTTKLFQPWARAVSSIDKVMKIRGARATPSTIGVLALDTVTTPFSVEITLSIEETARAHGWNSFVVNMFSDDRPEAVVDPVGAGRLFDR